MKISFPIIFIFSIFALLPSSTSISISIRFLGLFISSISTVAPYLPLAEYDLTNSDFTFSKVDLLYTSPSLIPTPSRLSNNCSVFKALFPDSSIADMDGLSSTVMINVLPSLPI